jgi:hypothetical protein
MTSTLINLQKKEYAKLLYVKENLSQQEIAERVGTTTVTISKWKTAECWDKLKASFVISREETLARVYAQINGIFEAAEKEKRPIESKEADTLSKLAATAKNLETDLTVSTVIDVFIRFGRWLREVDHAAAKTVTEYQDTFIKTLLNG